MSTAENLSDVEIQQRRMALRSELEELNLEMKKRNADHDDDGLVRRIDDIFHPLRRRSSTQTRNRPDGQPGVSRPHSCERNPLIFGRRRLVPIKKTPEGADLAKTDLARLAPSRYTARARGAGRVDRLPPAGLHLTHLPRTHLPRITGFCRHSRPCKKV